jgi:hypothetical protein
MAARLWSPASVMVPLGATGALYTKQVWWIKLEESHKENDSDTRRTPWFKTNYTAKRLLFNFFRLATCLYDLFSFIVTNPTVRDVRSNNC